MHIFPPVLAHSTSHPRPRGSLSLPPKRIPGVDYFMSPACGLGEWSPRGGWMRGTPNLRGELERLEELDEVRVSERLTSVDPDALALDVDRSVPRIAAAQQVQRDGAHQP